MKKSILCAVIITTFIIIPTAFAGRVDLTTYYPAPYGEYKNLKSTEGSNFATTSGNVGIGTTSPGSKLSIMGATGTATGISLGGASDSLTTSRYVGITRNSDNTDLSANSGFSGIEFGPPGGTGEGYLAFHTHDLGVASGERMRIDKSGYVGIGTTSPSERLNVAGNILATGVIIANSGSGFRNNVWVGGFNPIWSFNNATAYGIGYYQVSSDILGIGVDAIGFHFGNTSTPPFYIKSNGYGYFAGGHNDLAENYFVSGKVLRGSLVSIDPTQSKTVTASELSHQSIIGIVSTTPGAVMDEEGGFKIGTDTKNLYENGKAPIALVGTAPTLVTSKNGFIDTGDVIGISNIPGFGAKMITAGNIVGKALEKLDTENACPAASSIESIVWPEDNGKNSQKPCFKLPDGTYVGKIMAAVNVSWYDPGTELNEGPAKEMQTTIKNQQSEIKLLKTEFCKKDKSYSWCAGK
ncbi:MAG: hypothetical protein WC484_07180 [Candidatus Omnitrophota bacterium]